MFCSAKLNLMKCCPIVMHFKQLVVRYSKTVVPVPHNNARNGDESCSHKFPDA